MKNETKQEGQATALIRCTPENAGEMRDLVQRWPELNALVRSLQAQGLFPGLRALQIRLTGDEKQVAKGLPGVMAENPSIASPSAKGALQ